MELPRLGTILGTLSGGRVKQLHHHWSAFCFASIIAVQPPCRMGWMCTGLHEKCVGYHIRHT